MTSLAAAVEGEFLAISPATPSSSSESAAAPAPPATPGGGSPKAAGTKAGGSPSSPPPPLTLSFHAGAAMLPHPAKAERGGEDAFYIAPDGLTFGVADGVGGWGELGIDAGAYARELMANCAAVAAAAEPGAARREGLDPAAILTAGHARTRAQGSATACVLALAPLAPAPGSPGSAGEADDAAAHVRAANLGDSGFLVVRGGALAFRSPPQQHGFNFPFQLGAPGSVADSPADAELFAVGVAAGDVVVAGTDGLWDNVFPGEAADLASAAAARGEPPGGAARALAALARTRAADPRVLSPFAEAAQAMGYPYTGGKMDDITVVVAYVAEGGREQGEEDGGKKKKSGGGGGGGEGARRRAPQQRSLL
jgi:protein phosphatase PTC7